MGSHRKPKSINPDEIDPSVYYYDEVYDDMQHEQEELVKTERKPNQQEGSKYIQGIIETAERRKSEKEIRKFKKFARDREEAHASGDLDNTDVFITKSYAKKLREMQDTMKKHSERDDDRVLNSFKRSKRADDEKESLEMLHESGSSATLRNLSEGISEASENKSEPLPLEEGNRDSHSSGPKIARRRLKTIEERREYLREILAKRTVGDKLKAAQERYRQRKSKT